MTQNATRAAILVRALRAVVETDRATTDQLFTDDVQVWTPAFTAASRAELVSYFDRRDDAFSVVTLEATPLDVSGEFAVAEWTVQMTHTGPLGLREQTLAATGLDVTVHGVAVAEFAGTLICALRQYWNELSLFEQLGLLPGDP